MLRESVRQIAVALVLGLGACGPGVPGWTNEAAVVVPGARRAQGDGDPAEGVRRVRPRAARPAAEAAQAVKTPPDCEEPSDLPVPPGHEQAVVAGRVVDASGDPIDDATVCCFLGVDQVTDETEDDGTFRIPVGVATGVVRCVTWARGHAVSVGAWHAIEEGDVVDLGTVRLAAAAPIRGRVVDPSGVPLLGGTSVRIENTGNFDAETWALLTRCLGFEDGESFPGTSHGEAAFEFASLPAGRYVLTAEMSGRTGVPLVVESPAEDLALRVSDRVPPLPVEFDATIRVLDADGAPAEFRSIFARCPPDGAACEMTVFRRDVAGGTTDVRVRAPEFPVRIVVTTPRADDAGVTVESAPEGEIEVRLPRPPGVCAISGTVTSNGVPLTWTRTPPQGHRGCYGGMSGVEATVSAMRRDGAGHVVSCTTASDGSFRLPGLDDAEYDVWARAESPPGGDLAPVTTILRAGAAGVLLDLPRAGRRPLEIRGPDGAPLDEVEASVEPMDEDADDAWCETRRASLVAVCLRPGASYRLAVRGRTGRVWTAWALVEGWTAGDAPIVVQLERGLSIAGRVVRSDGSAVPGAYVFAERGEAHADAYAGVDGEFLLTGLDPGAWSIVAGAPGLSNADAPVTTFAGATHVRLVVGR